MAAGVATKGEAMSSWGVAGVKGIEESLQAGKAKALHSAWIPVLARVPLFQALSKRHLRRVARLAELKRYSSGEQVVRAGGRGDAFYIILDGSAQVTPAKGRGRKLGEGDFFGELALLDGAPRSATVTAVDNLTTARIARSAFTGLLKEEPAMGIGLAHGLVAIVRDLQS
jgi:CRP-like cAMP-binding protein